MTSDQEPGGGAAREPAQRSAANPTRGAFRAVDPQSAPRCPQCGYLLFGLQTPVCPECGLEVTGEELLAARWLADSNADNRAATARERFLLHAGVALCVAGPATVLLSAGYRRITHPCLVFFVAAVLAFWALLFRTLFGWPMYVVMLPLGVLWALIALASWVL